MSAVGIVAAMTTPELMGASFTGATWDAWYAAMGGAFGELLTPEQTDGFKHLSGGRKPLAGTIARELWILAGRRGGKTNVMAGTGVYLGTIHVEQTGLLSKLSPGETGVIAMIAQTRDQATVLFSYALGIMEASPLLGKMIHKAASGVIELTNGVRLEVFPNNFRSVRGRTLLAAILDECAFFGDDSSALPDVETYRALKPALATTGGPLIGISSPYAKKGLIYEKWRKHYGREGDVLVLQGGTRDFNPTISQTYIDEQLADDPEGNRAEYLAEFRGDISSLIDREIVEAVTRSSPLELPFEKTNRYVGFVDPSGGGKDAFGLAIAHHEGEAVVIDLVRGRHGVPAATVAEYAVLLGQYHIDRVTGDWYGGSWVSDEFSKHDIRYDRATKPKSDLYRDLLPRLHSGTIELPPDKKLLTQLSNLERTTARSGKDCIDHSRGQHDDLANCIAGVASLKARSGYDLAKLILGHSIDEESASAHVQRRAEANARFRAHLRAHGFPLE